MAFGLFGGSSNTDSDKTASPVPVAPLSTSTLGANAAQAKKLIQEQISQELAIANATELVQKITENCFQNCVKNPGSTIDAAQKKCTEQCFEKYMHGWNLVSRAYITRIQQSKYDI
ncbi:putative mitochondrial import inner membrane translocase subunit [Nadsonia fulvescens var. elongata DSM 6958]|uniref:Mitochondrial import inner membrane translocase subunit n=1 Tax=Nadsonia fulvescens var. elongata DSM 6958 TaxID=857566 RepID=A0A1E3PEM5_9ASCO|nr:putative mitochondrial import inner membrane translocase subunit [Nadsonia fulvescens var. elongata DSM 6958]